MENVSNSSRAFAVLIELLVIKAHGGVPGMVAKRAAKSEATVGFLGARSYETETKGVYAD